MLDFICPICKVKVRHSEYLHNVFKDDEYAEYAANLVTHYRHQHTNYYDAANRSWRYRSKCKEYQDYESWKAMVNNRAKRQLIRYAKKNFEWKKAKPLIAGFLKLQNNDKNTNKLIAKILHLTIFQKQARLDSYEKC